MKIIDNLLICKIKSRREPQINEVMHSQQSTQCSLQLIGIEILLGKDCTIFYNKCIMLHDFHVTHHVTILTTHSILPLRHNNIYTGVDIIMS